MKVICRQYRFALYSVLFDQAQTVDMVILQPKIHEDPRSTMQQIARRRSEFCRVRYEVKDWVQFRAIDYGTERCRALLHSNFPDVLHFFFIVNKHKDVHCIEDDSVHKPGGPRRGRERHPNCRPNSDL